MARTTGVPQAKRIEDGETSITMWQKFWNGLGVLNRKEEGGN